MFLKNELYYQNDEFKKLGLSAYYSTIKAGIPAPYNSPSGLSDLENLIKTIGLSHKTLVYARQTHSDNIVILEDYIKDSYDDVDGFITKRHDLIIATFYADCLPIFMYDKKQKIIGLCHSGWVGTYKGIGKKMLELFTNKFNSNLADIHITLGIGIGDCCYEVSKEFYDKFNTTSSKDLITKSFYHRENKLFFNNEDYNYYNFINLGINNISKSNLCTYCNNDFHSFRRDKDKAGRNVALLAFE